MEDERKKYDPMYNILFAPEDFIREYLETGISIIYKKYGKRLSSNRRITKTFDLLMSSKYENDDIAVKIVALLFMTHHEPELALAIEQRYDTSGGFFEERGPQMFRKFMQHIKDFITKTLHFPYNQTNIVQIVNNFVKGAKTTYIMGK